MVTRKSQSETDAIILAQAKEGDFISHETSSIIHRRHTRSVHPVRCPCSLCKELRFQHFSTKNELKEKDERGWYDEELPSKDDGPPIDE